MGCAGSKQEAVLSATILHQAGKVAPSPVSELCSCEKPGPCCTKGPPSEHSTSSTSASPTFPLVSLYNPAHFDGESAREKAVKALGLVDTAPEKRFDTITQLMASLFKTPVALITLITEDRVWFKSKVGPFGACVDRDGSWCNYIAMPNEPEVLITEDASKDARFVQNPYVEGAPHIKFYAGAPLVGTGGMRYGTLCVVDIKPRSFSAEFYAMLTNFAELAVQELERDRSMVAPLIKDAMSFADRNARLQRAVSSATEGVVLLDTRLSTWPVLYANDAFTRSSGLPVDRATKSAFWEQFELVQGRKTMADVHKSVAAGKPVRVSVHVRGTDDGHKKVVNMILRPAASDQLAPSKPVGIPNWVPSEQVHGAAGSRAAQLGLELQPQDVTALTDLASCFWFAVVFKPEEALSISHDIREVGSAEGEASLQGTAASAKSRSSSGSLTSFSAGQPPPELAGLTLGPLLGSGSFGRVYRGNLADQLVAVKVVDMLLLAGADAAKAGQDPLKEAVLSRRLKHRNVVETYVHAVDPETSVLWLVTQHCNRGTLLSAVERGWLKEDRVLTAPPHMPAILRMLTDVAEGMAYLHASNVLHCDLSGNNVLLDCDKDDGRLVARVCDFGLARLLGGEEGAASVELMTKTFGTLSHMAPEVLHDGLLTKAADVWSFGVLGWELYSGTRAHVGRHAAAIIFSTISGRGALVLPDDAPQGYKALVEACLNRDHEQRPSFEDILHKLHALLAELEQEP